MKNKPNVILLIMFCACNQDAAREKNEAKLFLTKLKAMDDKAELSVLEPQVNAFRSITFSSPNIKRAHEACVMAYENMLAAEKAMKSTEQTMQSGSSPTEQRLKSIGQFLEAAQSHKTLCFELVEPLVREFGP